ncbi:MAG: hypothetical protein RJA57_935 [Bacteroidota bacterium]|jgi:S1-C subfamily serine protease
MEQINLLDSIERYIRGEMNPDERLRFENLRKADADVDQLVVEHTLFLQQLNHFGERRSLRSNLNEIHTRLTQEGRIDSMKLRGRARVVYLWKRYKRVATIAAAIAGITTLSIIAMAALIGPRSNSNLVDLNREFQAIKKEQINQKAAVKNLKDRMDTEKTDPAIQFKSGGTGFLIDGKGILVTNAHIIRNSRHIAVLNNRGEEFRAELLKRDDSRDIAILRIDDESFKPVAPLPYGISRTVNEVAEPVYTLGYPRNDIVYSEGYLSARTGYNGDTLSCQLGIAANRGNSGGPVFNRNGEVIGVLSNKETKSEGVAFAVQSRYIFEAVEDLKASGTYRSIKLPTRSSVRGLSKQDQVKRMLNYVFLVKGD